MIHYHFILQAVRKSNSIMGSLQKATIEGFICCVCLNAHNNVILIYGDKGRNMQLAEKMQAIKFPGYAALSTTNILPKTICRMCIAHLDVMYARFMNLPDLAAEPQQEEEKKKS